MNKKSMIVRLLMAAALFFGGIWSCRSLSVIGGILLMIGAILYLPIPPISRLWKKPETKIGVMTLVSVLIVASIIVNNVWFARHPDLIQTAPVSTSSGNLPESSSENTGSLSENPSTASASSSAPAASSTTPAATVTEIPTQTVPTEASAASFDLSTVPAYSGSPYAEVNGNQPFFTADDVTTRSYETYGDLDSLGRCTAASACIGKDLMPTEKRGNIGSVKPTGWHTVKYAGVDGNYLYNRCHLIGYQLTGENANEKNLITGTRYMNVDGMEPFESMTADYIKETGNHVLYRITPVFEGNNLVASGVLMEAESVEDNGAGILFCVYCYNVQPGVTIDYATGDSTGPEYTGSDAEAGTGTAQESAQASQPTVTQAADNGQTTTAAYIGNSNSMKFHKPDCPSVAKMSDSNKVEFSTRDEAVAEGYQPCKQCNP